MRPDTASDERLVEQVRAGSERAFEAIFDRHHRPVLAFCRQMLGSQADAEDALQHTFLNAYRDLSRSERSIALRPWLYAIARHRCLSVLRSRRERPVAELPQPATEHLDAEVGRREDVRATLADVAKLPDDQRAALVLAELGDVSHEEIARIVGCRREKVKALLFQARTALAHDRAARDTSCAEIRAQLAIAGGGLRHMILRRHLRECPGCRAFHRRTRVRLGVLLPIAPAFGLKRALLGALSGLGGGAGGGAAATGGGLAATALAAVAIAGGGTGAGATAASEVSDAVPRTSAASKPVRRVAAATRPVPVRDSRERSASGHVGKGSGEPVRLMSTTQSRERPTQARTEASGGGGHAPAPEPRTDRGAEERPKPPDDATTDAPADQAGSSDPATGRGHPEPGTSRGQAEQHKPVGTSGNAKPAEHPAPPKANGHQKPAAPDEHPGKPPATARETAPTPGPPANGTAEAPGAGHGRPGSEAAELDPAERPSGPVAAG